MRILTIGGSGFIGRFVTIELARRGHDVAVFHRAKSAVPTARSIVGDRKQLRAHRDVIAAFQPDVIVDLVLSSEQQAQALVEVARGLSRRIVALSSMDVYRACGVTHRLEPGPLEPLPLTEESAVRTKLETYPPQQMVVLQQVFGWLDDHYDKIPVERVVLGATDLEPIVLRLPMVYGPGDPLRRLLPITKRIADGRRGLIFPESLASWRATRGYVENVAEAIALAAIAEPARGIYNVGDPDTLTELAWAEQVARAMGWDGELVVLPDDRTPPHLKLPGNTDQHWVVDTSKLRRELGYTESVDRDEAIRRTVAWERATPVVGFVPYQFDYAAEDAALG
ncbi:MAG TPA: NAD-dependent epimerase/dehydratase family protein [Kofleriaceae bacterium]|nr:NAD-dependent epimerase/dehydratase family protein [Kofleriaceae bacterium]